MTFCKYLYWIINVRLTFQMDFSIKKITLSSINATPSGPCYKTEWLAHACVYIIHTPWHQHNLCVLEPHNTSMLLSSLNEKSLYLIAVCLFFLIRMKESGVSPDWPSSIYITFQIYRFPPTTTHRLSLQTPDQAQHNPRDTLPCVLAAVNQDGTVNTGRTEQRGTHQWLMVTQD